MNRLAISHIPRWAECETYALSHNPRPARHIDAATLVGSLAHGHLSGTDGYLLEIPDNVRWDRTTANGQQAITQSREIAEEARRELGRNGWKVVQTETEVRTDVLIGRMDMRAFHPVKGEAIIELKTGQRLNGAWLQVAGYIAALSHECGTHPAVEHGGILHVQRVAVSSTGASGTLELRSAKELLDTWNRLHDRVALVLAGFVPLRTPGLHCQRCSLSDCPVRE